MLRGVQSAICSSMVSYADAILEPGTIDGGVNDDTSASSSPGELTTVVRLSCPSKRAELRPFLHALSWLPKIFSGYEDV